MTGNVQPLDQQFPIVDAQGRPTLYFIQWAQQRQMDIGGSAQLKGGNDFTGNQNINGKITATEGFVPAYKITNGSSVTEIFSNRLCQIKADQILLKNDQGIVSISADTGSGNIVLNNGANTGGAFIGYFSANNRMFMDQWGIQTGFEFTATPYVNTNKIFHEGNLSFGSGLTYNALTGVLTASGGGNWWAASKPLAASFPTRINTTNPITLSDDADIGLIIDAGTPVNDSLLRIAARAGPPAVGDFTVKARISATLNTTANCGAALCLVDTVSNRAIFWGRFSNNPVNGQRWTLPTGLNSNIYTSTVMGDCQTAGWFGFSRVGTTLNFLYSADGKNWSVLYSENATAWLANSPNFVGLCTNYQTALGSHIYLSSDYWSQTW